MLPWAAGLTDQPATGSDEKRNPIELTNQGLADDAVRPYNCRHLKKVGFGTLEKANLQKKLWKEVFNPNPQHWKNNGWMQFDASIEQLLELFPFPHLSYGQF